MIAVYFIYGLAFFGLGLAILLDTRQTSELALGRQLPWLAIFGLTHCAVEWSDMFLQIPLSAGVEHGLLLVRTVMLPVSALFLIRFGIGLVMEVGPLPAWFGFVRVVLLVPVALLVAYVVTVLSTEPDAQQKAEVWSRYLFYFPGSLIVSFGFWRHWRNLPRSGLVGRHNSLLAAAFAFLLYAITAGLIVPRTPYLLAPWLNLETVQRWTEMPAQVWRTLIAFLVTASVIRALNVFKAERDQQLRLLRQERERAQQDALRAQRDARQMAENWIEALVSVSRQIATLEPLDAILNQIVQRARRLLPAYSATLALWSEDFEQLVVKAIAAPDDPPLPADPVQLSVLLDAVRSGRSQVLPAGLQWHCPVVDRDILSAAVAPLTFEGQTLGGLWVVGVQAQAFGPTELDHLEHLSSQAVIAIQHAIMAARLQSLAVIEERSRIAREMHDGLAQILGYLSLEMQTLEMLVAQGSPGPALDELGQIRRNITVAQADVRENILSLRTTLSGDAGLLPSLQEYLREFSIQTGIETEWASDLADEPHLSPLAEAQLVRIVQEALSNVRKHAQAGRVQVRLDACNGGLQVTIRDDGSGFQAATQRGHFGLQTMRERSESVGGGLTITSAPQQGTQVMVWLPLVEIEPAAKGLE